MATICSCGINLSTGAERLKPGPQAWLPIVPLPEKLKPDGNLELFFLTAFLIAKGMVIDTLIQCKKNEHFFDSPAPLMKSDPCL